MPATPSLVVAGLTPMTTLDFPDRLACVVFTQGCPLRCGYCHNPQMLPTKQPTTEPGEQTPNWQTIEAFLTSRRGLLEAVVFSGGEPTSQAALLPAVIQTQQLGFKVGLHTSGVNPSRLEKLLPYLDWVGLDIKAEPADYQRITGRPGVAKKAEKSLQLIQTAACNYQVRTTLHPQDFNLLGINNLLHWLAEKQVSKVALQIARAGQCLDPAYQTLEQPFLKSDLQAIVSQHQSSFSQLLLS
ncbi:anaerobic ribonucleoside-triphosphate reductase activating protein [Marinospirillum insulare]|uniref:Anaerobic ribonucleoside-triphosphate reductase activating protein n=1 Tax=Marinospirillum insulare TaxID=217169 RepID=A0ABQ5ZUZ4_9GAMM|nr:anaerobic ribonucleoside-triphosphate reductase activating protein [Marinospirillum insulare]GLR64011.1 anaerobic ribonucleoside-triphosphate reductase activating protein [Marinospirillum insulare]